MSCDLINSIEVVEVSHYDINKEVDECQNRIK